MKLFSILFLITHLLFSQEKKPPIIDVHLHIEVEIWARSKLCFPQPCDSPKTRDDILSSLDELTIAEMDKNNIVLGVLSEYNFDNVIVWDKNYPKRFIKGIVVGDPKEANLELIEKELQNKNLQVLGEITAQYFNYAIDDPELEPYFELASKYDVPVFVHVVGLGGDPNFPIELGNPMRLTKVLSKYPNMRLWMENGGWPYLNETIAIMYTYPNVYVDMSTITWIIPKLMFEKYLKGFIDAGLGKRIMFGSDQMLWPEVISEAVQAIEGCEFLSEEQKRDIFYNNAARFFRLSNMEIKEHHK